MRHTESYFGLENHSGRITADGGSSYLPKLHEMEDFSELVVDIEHWLGKDLNIDELDDLVEILK